MEKENRMKSSLRRKKWKKIGCAGILFLFCLAFALIMLGYRELLRLEEALKQTEGQLGSYKKILYVASEPLTKGMVVSEEKVRKEIRYTDQRQEVFMEMSDFGKELALDVAEGTCLQKSMLRTIENNVREVFLNEIELPGHLENGCRADIRIRFPNAEDYTVLSDKIIQLSSNGGVVLALDETELLLLSAAVEDCFRYERTRLYAVKYPEYQQTEPGDVNYIANQEILDLLGETKEKKEERVFFEKRLESEKND